MAAILSQPQYIKRYNSSQLSVVCCLNEMWLISLTGGLVMPYGDRESEIWVNIGSGNGLLLDGAKPLPESMLTTH